MMRPILLLLVLHSLATPALALKTEDLVGEWRVTSDQEMDEGIWLKSDERVIYLKDGTYYSDGTAIMYAKESGGRMLTVSAPEKGTWKVNGEELHVQTKSSTLEFFSSAIPALDRKATDKSLQDTLADVTISTVIPNGKDRFSLVDKEDGTKSQLQRAVDEREAGTDSNVSPATQKTAPPSFEPLATYTLEELGGDPTVKVGSAGKQDIGGERMRRTSRAILAQDGFTSASHLPTFGKRAGIGTKVRPQEEIVARLLCTYVSIVWVTADEKDVPSEKLKHLVEHYRLGDRMTDDEKAIFALPRDTARTKHEGTIGWRMENLLALAWVLGCEQVPDIDDAQADSETFGPVAEFVASAWKGRDEFGKGIQLRPAAEIAQLEDVFYCAHNAVRSAQSGNARSVPKWFHPVRNGGVIHEKRHALTWVLSPGVDWEKTDLST